MQYLTEILRIVEGAVTSDRKKVSAYANLLVDKLENAGDEKSGARLRRVLAGATQSAIGTASLRVFEHVPVDTESRLSLADESVVQPGEVLLHLDPNVRAAVSEFLNYVKQSDKLLAEGLGITPTLLMFGPPGCGKTEIARLIASELQLPLITTRTDTIVSSYLGNTAKNLRMLFDHASSRPCVLFLDEFDSIAKLRDDAHELGELKRVVVSLLQNIDAVAGRTVVVAATNHEHLLDPAVWRRFAYRLKVDLPDMTARRAIFETFLLQPLRAKAFDQFAEASSGMSGSDIQQICEAVRRESVLRNETALKESDVFRRLLMVTLNANGLSMPELIIRAKTQCPRVYTHRTLAEALGMAPSNITYILKKQAKVQATRKEQT